ncbi:MAG: hypothetical protein WDO24_20535 [Pseudomonadota bacterium]
MNEELPKFLAKFLERMGLELLDLADRVKLSPDIDAKPIIFLAVDMLNAALAMEHSAAADGPTEAVGILH